MPRMNHRPELPELESVCVEHVFSPRSSALLVWALLLYSCVFVGLWVAHATVVSKLVLTTGDVGYLSLFGAVAIICLVILRRSAWCATAWSTDSSGLRARGILFRRFIQWTDVRFVRTRWVRIEKSHRIEIRGSRASVFIPVSQPTIEASIWQHLARLGKADDIELSEEAESLWYPVTGRISTNMRWENRMPRRLWQAAAEIPAICISVYLLRHYKETGYVMAFIATAVIWRCWSAIRTPKGIRLVEDGLKVDIPLRAMNLPWNQIRSAQWKGQTLILTASWPKSVQIPWDSEDEESTKMMIAIIRKLRTTDHPTPVTLPPSLRAAADMIALMH